ncbi:hypothetical protein HYN59_02350 [Flavobacterium album]|uniref:TonB C-terminal domain-containing protein n=1 Tax=Flavobacterium album TaxID=2175091 RepID=A0A2S1QUT4_9FLAO|nr:hypothetical protein [Flavobacterium album]AWH84021.1 hypothetical protein HYN59_02350 [Flavobacterium album]
MKKTIAIVSLLILSSCQYFEKQVPDEDALLQKRLKEINWKEVSSYPSMAECDPILDKEQKKECFFELMARLVQEKLDLDTISMLYPEIDTINVKVTVYPDATLKFEPEMPTDSVSYNTTTIDSILKTRLVDFPKIEPAQKEGVPVTTQFILPVILDVK